MENICEKVLWLLDCECLTNLPVSTYLDENHWIIGPSVYSEFLEYFWNIEFWQM